MLDELMTDKLRQKDRHRIPDLSCHRSHAALESEVFGECLQAGGFADADGPMLLRVAETTVGVARAPCGKP